MRIVFLVLVLLSSSWSMRVHYQQWEKGMTFSDYMKKWDIPPSLLGTISKEDQKFLLEIRNDSQFYELTDDKGRLEQALIPISKEMQIHLFKENENGKYGFDIIPIQYSDDIYFGRLKIHSNPYQDALEATHYPKVAERLSMALKGVINANRLHEDDEIDFLYSQRTRLGMLYTPPLIKAVHVRIGRKVKFIYVDEDGYGYDEINKKVAYTVTGKKKIVYTRRISRGRGSRFRMPLRHARITSGFSYKRWHPILHRYRPHHGTDFGAKRGTPIYAVNDGRVIYAGWMGGYGRVVKIRHGGGYVSLYAHQSRIRVKRGQYVKKGKIIGYVGNSGRSTGSHLHFGMMKNGRWVNPMKVLRRKSVGSSYIRKKFTKYQTVKTTKYRKVEIKDAEKNKRKLETYLIDNAPSYIWDKVRYKGKLRDEEILEYDE